MKRKFLSFFAILITMLSLTGCGIVGSKTASMSFIYALTAVLSLLLLISYCYFIQNKDLWYQLLFTSVFVVNIGYFSLSISSTVEEALLANRIAYLGSVFLPLIMLFLILNETKIKYPKWLIGLLFFISIVVFLIAASPGFSDVYYSDVYLTQKNGVTILNKVYGPLHSIYLYYLLGYFGAMVITIVYTTYKKKLDTNIQAVILASAVFVNLVVWFVEQLVHIEFEILSISYIISELFLLSLHLIILENETLKQQIEHSDIPAYIPAPVVPVPEHTEPSPAETESAPELDPSPADPAVSSEETDAEQLNSFLAGIQDLTPTESTIFNRYISGNSTKEIMAELNIKENTLKFHNKNIYSKLGVSSRKQLIELYRKSETQHMQ